MKLACAVLAMLVMACSPRMPDQARAREDLAARRAGLDRACERTRRELEASPIATVCQGDDFACKHSRPAAARRFASDILPQIVRDLGALGAKGFFKSKTPGGNYELGSLPPCTPGLRTGSVRPEDGFSEGPFSVGYGLYQTSWSDSTGSHGDGKFHPGLEITWTHAIATGVAEFRVCLLSDGTPRPP